MFLVSAQKRSNRLQICKNCEHYLPSTKSCGTLGFGTEVEAENGKRVKLCGCVMPIKTRLKIATCPLEKWEVEITKRDIDHIKNILKELEGATTISMTQNNQLTQLWNRAAGQNRSASTCNSCVRKMIGELKTMIQDE